MSLSLTMRPSELSALLAKTIPAGFPILIKGGPGIGKSDVVAEAADACGANLQIHHPVIEDPTDPKGMPCYDSKSGEAKFVPFGNLKNLMTTKTRMVCFIDDLGQAAPLMQAAYMQIILARQIGGHKISDKVTFVAATNRREDKAGVSGIIEPLKSRFASIVELAPNLDDWCLWALANGVAPEVVAFNRFRPELFGNPGPITNDIVNRPSPRTITNMAKLFGLGIDDLTVLAGAVGQGYASEFIGFLRVWRSLPSIDAILINPGSADVPTEPAALYAIATALATRIADGNAGRVLKYFTRMPSEFCMLGIRDSLRKCPTAANNKGFIEWMADNSGFLM